MLELSDNDLLIAGGVLIYFVSLLFVWHVGRERLGTAVQDYIATLEKELDDTRKELFLAQSHIGMCEKRLSVMREKFVESRETLEEYRQRLADFSGLR